MNLILVKKQMASWLDEATKWLLKVAKNTDKPKKISRNGYGSKENPQAGPQVLVQFSLNQRWVSFFDPKPNMTAWIQ